ncbi:prepilin-type N-terminal cleavage/methylation domain-containing protein [Enterovibrio norvegicus]|uniref:prepilin-type N-terminal cleavage/methylation domain-containing protein n=1 Tax=Enterovibrio norvegicus TaxID=188144 RepID=UPI000309A216|nr:prepilin-type N-terminal cleavage/methylation domain-containing protein [Enterovibrio norvegicus]
MTMRKEASGYTLVELMVGLTVSLIVLASSTALFSVSTNMGSAHLQRDFLRSQLNLIANTLKNDIARAGFCYDCASSNPFIVKDAAGLASSILIDDSATQVTKGSCIRFAYNHDKRAGVMTPGKDDAMGYRLGKDPDDNQVIEIYENWKALTNWKCDSGYWRDMTYDRLEITDLTFKRAYYEAVVGSNKLQSVEVKISASLKSNSAISDSVSFTVSVPNVDG